MPLSKFMLIQDQVDNPMWFNTEVINEDFVRGYSQAVYQIRLKLTSMDQEPEDIRKYTEFMIQELNKISYETTNSSRMDCK